MHEANRAKKNITSYRLAAKKLQKNSTVGFQVMFSRKRTSRLRYPLTQTTLLSRRQIQPIVVLRAAPATGSDELDLDLRDNQSRTLQVKCCRMQVCSVCMPSSPASLLCCSVCRQHHSLQQIWQPSRFCGSTAVSKAYLSTEGA